MIMFSSFRKNTLGILDMKIVKTADFMKRFEGEDLIVWFNNTTAVNVAEFSRYSFFNMDEKGPPEDRWLVLVGRGNSQTLIKADSGFGFKVVGVPEKNWIDKMNEDEMAVIVYSSRTVHLRLRGDSDNGRQ